VLSVWTRRGSTHFGQRPPGCHRPGTRNVPRRRSRGHAQEKPVGNSNESVPDLVYPLVVKKDDSLSGTHPFLRPCWLPGENVRFAGPRSLTGQGTGPGLPTFSRSFARDCSRTGVPRHRKNAEKDGVHYPDRAMSRDDQTPSSQLATSLLNHIIHARQEQMP